MVSAAILRHRSPPKLLDRMKASADPEPPVSTGRLGDWYAHYVTVHRQHVVLAVSERTLLPVVLPAAPISTLIPRLAESVADVLHALGIPDVEVEGEMKEMRDVTLGKTENRSVVGSTNDFVRLLDPYLDDRTPMEAALKLAEVPCKPIGWANPGETGGLGLVGWAGTTGGQPDVITPNPKEVLPVGACLGAGWAGCGSSERITPSPRNQTKNRSHLAVASTLPPKQRGGVKRKLRPHVLIGKKCFHAERARFPVALDQPLPAWNKRCQAETWHGTSRTGSRSFGRSGSSPRTSWRRQRTSRPQPSLES
jgi:hypothetical protein